LEGGQFNGSPVVCVVAGFSIAGGYRKLARVGVRAMRV
jgi:hypothetical protein